MNPSMGRIASGRPSVARRGFLQGILVAGLAPAFVPGTVFGAEGRTRPSDKITLGVIGVGAQGTSDMQAFLALPDVRVTAICDVNQKAVDRARAIIGNAYGSADVRVYDDFRALSADPAIDAVLVALPVHWHAIPALEVIRQGKHIYLEKPMALSFEESTRVREAVRRRAVVFQFGTQQRSDRRFRWACELALNGRLGKVREIRVSVPGGKSGPRYPEQPVPAHLDWNRWVGPAPTTPFHEDKLQRDNHENMTRFSLGMISCWGIHHLDIAQWGNGTDDTGPTSIEGTGDFPTDGDLDAILRWKVRFEFAKAAPVTFVNDGTAGYPHGVRFVGESGWVHVSRGAIEAHAESFLTDPENQCGTMPHRLPVSLDHGRNFIDAIKTRTRAISDIEIAVRGDTLCQLALIAVKQGRRLRWNPETEQFDGDTAAMAALKARPYRGDWRLPEV